MNYKVLLLTKSNDMTLNIYFIDKINLENMMYKQVIDIKKYFTNTELQ